MPDRQERPQTPPRPAELDKPTPADGGGVVEAMREAEAWRKRKRRR